MASRPESGIEIDKALFATATRIARDKCQLHKAQIADRAGMSQRMLHRLLTGTTRATEEQRERILRACSLPAMTSRLLAESNQIDLIGTVRTTGSRTSSRMSSLTSPRSGRRRAWMSKVAGPQADAALILARWQALIERGALFSPSIFRATGRGTRADGDQPNCDGRRAAHGISFSSCPARRNSVASSP